jgi:hypothetical protein
MSKLHVLPFLDSEKMAASRRQVSTAAMTTGVAVTLRPRSGWAADTTDSRVADIVAKTIGIDTHNHVAAEMPGPDIDLKGEMKQSGLSAICMTFATDYQPGDAYDRFLEGLASMDRQSERINLSARLRASCVGGVPGWEGRLAFQDGMLSSVTFGKSTGVPHLPAARRCRLSPAIGGPGMSQSPVRRHELIASPRT